LSDDQRNIAARSEHVEIAATPEQAKALLHPLRQRIIDLLEEPDSAAGLARKLDMPRQKVNYHLRKLERIGLLEEVDRHTVGSVTEKRVRAVARTWFLNPEVLGVLDGTEEQIADRWSWGWLVSRAGRMIRDLAKLRQRSERAGKRLATYTQEVTVSFAGPGDRAAFTEELANEIAHLLSKYHSPDAPGARTFTWLLFAHPTLTKHDPEKASKRESYTGDQA
jgi:DNA-binding transcriptional ArsR family regulator